jgi:mono/diheme cytochrome c family protein
VSAAEIIERTALKGRHPKLAIQALMEPNHLFRIVELLLQRVISWVIVIHHFLIPHGKQIMSNSIPLVPPQPVINRRCMMDGKRSRCFWGIAFTLILCKAIPLMGQSKPQTQPVQPLRASSKLFAQHCASCHDQDGSGKIARSQLPRLPDFRVGAWQSARSDARLQASIVNGRGSDMPPFRRELTDVQVRELLRVVRGFGPKANPVSQASDGDFASQFQALEREFEELEQQIQSLRRSSTRREKR